MKKDLKKALITGITGQDGSYLTELLLEKGYEVHGLVRRSSSFSRGRIDGYLGDPDYRERLFLHYGDVTDTSSVTSILMKIRPDEIYHLAAQSHVGVSFEMPEYTAAVDAMGTLRILDAVRVLGLPTRFYQASTSELFGKTPALQQNESTPFHPRSPYGIAKLYSYWTTRNYREAYGTFASNGILFNHESPRRGENFVSRKITLTAARIRLGLTPHITLGNLYAKRDWGYAPEYVEGMWRILQHNEADDFVLATGETHTIKEFVDATFAYLGLELEWDGEGLDEKGRCRRTGRILVDIDRRYHRPSEVEHLHGDATKAKTLLGWEPKTRFDELVRLMVDSDLAAVAGNRERSVLRPVNRLRREISLFDEAKGSLSAYGR